MDAIFSLDQSLNPREETVQQVGRNKGGFPKMFDYIILSNIGCQYEMQLFGRNFKRKMGENRKRKVA